MEHTYGYYDNGNIEFIQRTNNSWYDETYTYDEINRLSTADCPGGTFSFTYDNVGNRLARTMNVTANVEELETYTYFTDTNKLESVENDQAADEWSITNVYYTYDVNGNTEDMTYKKPNPPDPEDPWLMGLKVFTYNQDNRLIEIDSTIPDATYTYIYL